MFAEAIEAFENAVQLSGNREGLPALAHAYARGGQVEQALEILEELKNNPGGRYQSSTMIARIYLGLGEIDQAFDWLQKGLGERSYWNIFLKVDPVYDAIRADPRFQNLLTIAGFDSIAQQA
jgi:pentatricopeptide repeat protein